MPSPISGLRDRFSDIRKRTGIRQNKFVWTHRSTAQGFSAALANRGCHLQKLTHQTRCSDTVQNSPSAAGLTWLSDDRAIHNPEGRY
jgi:hypothetical protein